MNPIEFIKSYIGKGNTPQSMTDAIELIKTYINKGITPQVMIKNMTKNNPIVNNLMSMAQNGEDQNLKNFARNMFKDKGRDFDKEFAEFKKNFK